MSADLKTQNTNSSHAPKGDSKYITDKKNISINLSGKQKESNGSIFYKWAINVGRIVIVLTELIALSALFYRFVIDRQIADLNDQIATQVLLIRSNEQKEERFRSVQNKLSMIKAIKTDTDGKISIMNMILDIAKSGEISTNNLSVSKNIVAIDGLASSIYSINNFVDDLKSNEYVSSISIGDITSTDTGISFKLQVSLIGLPENETEEVLSTTTL